MVVKIRINRRGVEQAVRSRKKMGCGSFPSNLYELFDTVCTAYNYCDSRRVIRARRGGGLERTKRALSTMDIRLQG